MQVNLRGERKDYADEDVAWDRIAEPVSQSELEAALEEI